MFLGPCESVGWSTQHIQLQTSFRSTETNQLAGEVPTLQVYGNTRTYFKLF